MHDPNSSCAICNRPLGLVRVDEHHLIPKTFRGKVTIPLHRICHTKIHATFAERDLAHYYFTTERILEHTEIQKFVLWVKKKPIDFYDKNDETRDRKRKRRKK
jgi:hypothetical protein